MGVGSTLVDVVGNSLTSEESGLNQLLVPNACVKTTTVHVKSMSVGTMIMISKKGTFSVVTVNSLAPFAYNTSNGRSDSRGKLASGTGVSGNLVERVFVDR